MGGMPRESFFGCFTGAMACGRNGRNSRAGGQARGGMEKDEE
jgi:hypothetical protein